jgi:hypothetical protein
MLLSPLICFCTDELFWALLMLNGEGFPFISLIADRRSDPNVIPPDGAPPDGVLGASKLILEDEPLGKVAPLFWALAMFHVPF